MTTRCVRTIGRQGASVRGSSVGGAPRRSRARCMSESTPIRAEGGRPRVVIDLTFADKSRTGTRVYARRLYDALARVETCDVETVSATPNPRVEGTGNLWTGAQSVWGLQV